jgi:hypothetical protein
MLHAWHLPVPVAQFCRLLLCSTHTSLTRSPCRAGLLVSKTEFFCTKDCWASACHVVAQVVAKLKVFHHGTLS